AEKRSERLEGWLMERLLRDYGVPHKIATTWIENRAFLFLFDGLDEVSQKYGAACVRAINAFWRRYNQEQIDNGIVVCSRIADYEKLSEPLHLGNAIALKTLLPTEVDGYLVELGSKWADLRAAIPHDPVLGEFAESPLLLNIMAVAYRETPRDQIIGL